jgi:hypothetical protein
MNMTKKSVLIGTSFLTILHSVGCGGTVDLAKLHETAGGGSTSQSPSQGGNTQGGNSAVAGGESEAGRAGNAAGGQGGNGVAGGQGGFQQGGGGSASTDRECQVDQDCVLCEDMTDPAASGCYMICCGETTPLNTAACQRNASNWQTLCEHQICAVDCQGAPVPPAPRCVSGQCVRGQ